MEGMPLVVLNSAAPHASSQQHFIRLRVPHVLGNDAQAVELFSILPDSPRGSQCPQDCYHMFSAQAYPLWGPATKASA